MPPLSLPRIQLRPHIASSTICPCTCTCNHHCSSPQIARRDKSHLSFHLSSPRLGNQTPVHLLGLQVAHAILIQSLERPNTYSACALPERQYDQRRLDAPQTANKGRVPHLYALSAPIPVVASCASSCIHATIISPGASQTISRSPRLTLPKCRPTEAKKMRREAPRLRSLPKVRQ